MDYAISGASEYKDGDESLMRGTNSVKPRYPLLCEAKQRKLTLPPYVYKVKLHVSYIENGS